MSRHQPYTPAEDAVILAGYQTRTLHEIAADLGRPFPSIQGRTYRLARQGRLEPSTRFYRAPWSPDAEQDLRGLWGYQEPWRVAHAVGRTLEACKIHAVRLGLSKAWRGRYTASAVGRIFDVDAKTVTRWLEAGDLAGKRSNVRASHSWRHEVQHEAIEAFIANHPARYLPQRIHDPYWRRLADQAAGSRLIVAEAARRLGVNRETVGRHIRRGWLAAEAVRWAGGHAWLIDPADLAGFRLRHPPVLGQRYRRGHCGALPGQRAASAPAATPGGER